MNGLPAALTIQQFITERLLQNPKWSSDEAAVCAFFGTALLHATLLIGIFATLPAVYIWLERKVAGRIQDRLGPTRVGGKFGWLQALADGVKLIQKEDLVPKDADSMMFRAAPYIATVASFAAFIVLPMSQGWVAVASECGAFLVFAVMSIEVLAIILAGYSSGSKWALFGAMREAAQMVSYEIPMAICALIPLVIAGSLNLQVIAGMQTGGFWNWFLFHDPFSFCAFFCFFTVATASVKRAPFDLAEAESELVAGFHTEYSGFRWSVFFLAEYASMFAVSSIATILFLGGWETGLAIPEAVLAGLRTWWPDFGGVRGFTLGNYIANVIALHVFILKASLLVFVQIWVRWTLPRLRIDQVMTTCLKYIVPISCVLFLGAVFWPLILVSGSGGRAHWGAPLGSKVVQLESSRVDAKFPLAHHGHEEPQASGSVEIARTVVEVTR